MRLDQQDLCYPEISVITPGSAYGVVVSDGFAYVADGTKDLR